MNLQSYAEKFIESKQVSNAATISQVHKLARYFKNDLSEIVYQDIDNYVIRRRKQRAASASINRELSVLKNIFSWLIRTGVLQNNPAAEIKMEKGVTVRDRWITTEEEEALISISPPG